MKFSHVLPLAALSSALVLPSEEVLSQISVEDNHRGNNGWVEEAVATKDEILSGFKKHFDEVTETSKNAWAEVSDKSKNALDEAFAHGSELADGISSKVHETAFDAEAWLVSEVDDSPHHGPHHGGPHHGGPHHGKPNQTVYELIASSKYTTKLAKLIGEFPDLVEELNSTKANYVCSFKIYVE